jgi:N-acetylglucosamine-6-phosphate deacetylase
MQIFSADKIFTGKEWLLNHAVVINNNRIKEIIPSEVIKENITHFANAFIAPAFIDLQIPDFINRTPKITQTALESFFARQFYPKASILSL